MISKKATFIILVVIAILMVVIGFFLKPIPQPLSYHKFADHRIWLGISNAWNVLSNIPFALAGIWGLFLLFSGKIHFIDSRERWPWIGISIGLILTALGSAYYHWAPDNARLVWDRLPMTIIFMSFVVALITDRINVDLGLWLWPLLLFIGICSVFVWYRSELHGAGDLRFYAAVQIYTIIASSVMLLAPSRYTRNWDLVVVAIFYGLAKLFEAFDSQIYSLCDGIISGHTLKHLAAAMAGVWMLWMAWKRKPARARNRVHLDP